MTDAVPKSWTSNLGTDQNVKDQVLKLLSCSCSAGSLDFLACREAEVSSMGWVLGICQRATIKPVMVGDTDCWKYRGC